MKVSLAVITLSFSALINAASVANADNSANLEARASMKCKFRQTGWHKVVCYYQGRDWEQYV